jgi:hypothetical protein
MEVWVDGVKKYTSTTATLDTALVLAPGGHRFAFLAINTAGHKEETIVDATVQSGCSVPSATGVHICNPVGNSTVSSPLNVQAAGRVSGTLARMEVWVDGVKKFTSGTDMLNTTLTLAPGEPPLCFPGSQYRRPKVGERCRRDRPIMEEFILGWKNRIFGKRGFCREPRFLCDPFLFAKQ